MLVAVSVAPANAPALALVPDLVEEAGGQGIGDRNDWGPALAEEVAPAGIARLAPCRTRRRDPDPAGRRRLTRLRWRIEPVAAQLVARSQLKRIWARDAWHLTGRLLRQVLSHTSGVLLCLERGDRPLHPARLLN